MTEPVDVESAAAKVQHMTRSLLDADVRAGAGATLAEKLRGLVSAHAQSVLVFIKPSCPFCTEVLCTFAALRVPVVTVELHDRDAKAALREVSSHATFPNVYIKGAHVGGCDTVKALQAKGELDALIGDLALDDDAAHTLAGIKPPARPRGVATHPLAWYPNTVNRWTVQGTGLLVVALCILGIIFREERWGWWLTAYLLLDFTCRFLAGGTASLLTQLAALAVSPFERGTLLRPQFKPGPPKQFAASVGVLFTTAATALYFNGQYAAGAAVLGALAGAAALEGFFDFCLGCVFFGFAVQLRIVPDYVYRIASNTLQETKTTWEYTQLPSGAPAPVRKEPADAGADAAPVALRYKVKSAEWTKDDFHVVRNMQVQYFAMPMGIAGLGVAFKMASRWTANWAVATLEAAGVTGASLPVVFYAQPRWWHTFGIAGAIVYCILMLLFLARVALFPRKVAKEWSCPWRGNAFALISANMLLFAFLVYDLHPRAAAAQRFARALWWTGAATNMCMTVAKMGEWISRALSKEHVNPGWMLIPATNLLAALVAPVLPLFAATEEATAPLFGVTARTTELASFFFAIGAFMWIVLFTITFAQVATSHNTQESVRASAYVWLTPPTIGGMAHLVINFARSADRVALVATFSQSYYLSIVIFLALAWAWAPHRQFFGQNKVDMSYWNMTFSLDALAASAAVWYHLSGFVLGLVLMVMFLSVAAGANALCLLHTLQALVKRRSGAFTPDDKFGPLSFMKLTHDAFREAMPRLAAALAALDPARPASVRAFAARYAQFVVALEEHSRHEDEVIFATFNDFSPHHADASVAEHAADRSLLAAWEKQINALLDGSADGAAAIVASLQAELPRFLAHFTEHMQAEEDHLSAIGRKYCNLELQKQLLRRVWAATPAARWEVIFPFIVEHCPRHMQRTRYVQSFTWAMPERAQQIGAILYRTTDAVMWERLRTILPHIVPRGAPHHSKYY